MSKETCKDISDCESHCKPLDEFHVAGDGEIVERNFVCEKCGRKWREVYLFSCYIDNDTEETIV